MKPRIFIAGLINWETNLQIPGFPLEYQPLHFSFWKNTSITAGVGINIALALGKLNCRVRFASLVGDDFLGQTMIRQIAEWGVSTEGILPILKASPASTILFDHSGRRQIHLDLKDIQETPYPEETFRELSSGSDAYLMTPLNICRPFLAPLREQGKLVATDLHVLGSADDDYHQDFLRFSDILFISDENCRGRERELIREIAGRFSQSIIVMGLGSNGALLWTRDSGEIRHFPALTPRPVVNTIGAGDALFSAFINFTLRREPADLALTKAILYAGWKVGGNGATDGLLSAGEFSRLEDAWKRGES